MYTIDVRNNNTEGSDDEEYYDEENGSSDQGSENQLKINKGFNNTIDN